MLWAIIIAILIAGLIVFLVYDKFDLGSGIILGILGSVAIVLTVGLIGAAVASNISLTESDAIFTETTEIQELVKVEGSLTSNFELEGFSVMGNGSVEGKSSSAMTVTYLAKTDDGCKPVTIDASKADVAFIPTEENDTHLRLRLLLLMLK